MLLSEGDLAAIRTAVQSVAAVAGTVSGSAPVVVGNANWTTSVNGVNEDFLEVRDLGAGRLAAPSPMPNFGQGPSSSSAPMTARELFSAGGPSIGEQARIKNAVHRDRRAYRQRSVGLGQRSDDTALVPINNACRRPFGAADRARTIFAPSWSRSRRPRR